MRVPRFLFLTLGFCSRAAWRPARRRRAKAGVAIGYPGGIGILWHATDGVAIRPDFSFLHNSSEGSSGSAGGVNLSVLFYLKNTDHRGTYVSPRFTACCVNSTP